MPFPFFFPVFRPAASIPAGLVVAAGLFLSGCAGAMQARNTHHALYKAPLAPYVRACMEPGSLIGSDSLSVVDVSPPVRPHYRLLPGSGGVAADSVSVTTGHRLMYAYRNAGYFFANVKIEQSNAAEYVRDKEVIERHLRSLRSTEDTNSVYSRRVMNGMPLHSYEANVLDEGGVIGIYTAFADRDHLVITAYLLNQGEKNRRFHTLAEYRILRDRFLDDLTACVTRASDSAALRAP